jgi:4-amino-4-deoxy-L-arabinose transferase-like glycosyltransferase
MGPESGSWLVPHLNGEVYDDKPPGFFWLVALLHDGLGFELDAAAKAVSVVAASLSVALVFALGRRLYGVQEGLAAALVLGSSEMFLSLALRGNLDALLSACITASLYACWRGEQAGNDASAGRWRLAAGGFAGLGMLVKGPVAIAIPAAAVLFHGGLARGWRRIRPSLWLPALAISLVPVLAWLAAAAAEAGPDYVRDLVVGHGIAHPLGGVSKLRPLWYYARSLPASFVPWSIALPACVALFASRRRRSSEDAFAIAWLCAPLVLLSLFPAKRHLYLLPLLPGAALLVSRWLGWLRSDPRAGEDGRTLLLLSRLAQGVIGLASIGLGLTLGIGATLLLAGRTDLLAAVSDPLRVTETLGAAAAVASLGVACVLVPAGAMLLQRWSGPRAWRADLAVGVATATFLLAGFHPFDNAARKVSPFYREVQDLVGSDELATYGARDWATNLLLRRTRVPRLVTLEQAEAHRRNGLESARPAWLVAEGSFLERHGRPVGFEEVLRYQPPLGHTLLLLRSELPSRAEAAPPKVPASRARALHSAWAPPFRAADVDLLAFGDRSLGGDVRVLRAGGLAP